MLPLIILTIYQVKFVILLYVVTQLFLIFINFNIVNLFQPLNLRLTSFCSYVRLTHLFSILHVMLDLFKRWLFS